MTNDLFSDFGVAHGDPKPQQTVQESNLEDLQNLAARQKAIRNALPVGVADKLNPIYVNQLVDAFQRYGKYVCLCARCHKPITDPSKLFFDQAAGFIYGTDCWARIQRKQTSLALHHANGSRIHATHDELQTYICSTTRKEFKALPENVALCGGLPRTCAVCPGTSLRYKNRPCDFEQAIRYRQTKDVTDEPL